MLLSVAIEGRMFGAASRRDTVSNEKAVGSLPITLPHRELDRAAAKEPAALSHLLNNLAALAPALVSAQERIGLKRVNDMFKFSLVVAYGFSPHQVRC
jgi:hypothetical protein